MFKNDFVPRTMACLVEFIYMSCGLVELLVGIRKGDGIPARICGGLAMRFWEVYFGAIPEKSKLGNKQSMVWGL